MKNDKRVQRNRSATVSTETLLKDFVKNPEKYAGDEALLRALKSQGGLAKLEYESEIDGEMVYKKQMSLNTHKSYSDLELIGGYEGVNALRLKAIEAIETRRARLVRPDSRSRVGMQLKIDNLEDELDKHRRVNFRLLQAVQAAMIDLRSVKDADDRKLRERRAEDATAKIRGILKLNPSPFDEASGPTVVRMGDLKDEE